MPGVLVLGGSGWIGQAVARALAGAGAEVVVADLAPPSSGDFLSTDVSRLEEVVAAVRQAAPEVLVNLAYLLAPAAEADQLKAQRVNLEGMLNAFEACRVGGVRRCVFASSIAVYGDQSQYGPRPVSEDDFGRPAMLYGWHKLMNEASARCFERDHGVECVALRLSTVFGSGPAAINQDLNLLIQRSASERAVDCALAARSAFNLLHVDDAAAAFWSLALAPGCRHRVYNSGGHAITLRELAVTLESLRPGLRVRLTNPDGEPVPRVVEVDWSRLRAEHGLARPSLVERLGQELASAS